MIHISYNQGEYIMKNIYQKFSPSLLIAICSMAAFVAHADEIPVKNNTKEMKYVGIFYTFTKSGDKILMPTNEDQVEWPEIHHLSPGREQDDIQRPPLKMGVFSGDVKLTYDRDIIALTNMGYEEFINLKKQKKIRIYFKNRPTEKGRGELLDAKDNIVGWWLNVGTLQGVSKAAITASGVVKAN